MAQAWEYKVLSLETVINVAKTGEMLTQQLNRLGADGWELVALGNSLFYLKRPH